MKRFIYIFKYIEIAQIHKSLFKKIILIIADDTEINSNKLSYSLTYILLFVLYGPERPYGIRDTDIVHVKIH